ncbi:MAG TPA: hypothetical protein VLQ48_13515, partial [Chloroflexia bacterium]|nr:hypothetical protein [Chloroflexia bacterium]
FVLGAYYLATTFRGFLGALRLAWLNMPGLWARTDEARLEVERKKQASLKSSEEPRSAYFDQAVRLKGKPDEPIRWQVGDKAGKLGELEVDGVRATYYPHKTDVNDSIFEFLADQIEQGLSDNEPDPTVQIVQWGAINDDESAAYYSMVRAFQNLERTLKVDKKSDAPIWPTVTIEQKTVDAIQGELEKLTPVLRNESFLPNVEYEVEWTVPILPEPLSFVQLKRHENRADPVFTMGCATLIVLAILFVIVLFIIFPPWVPSK